MIEQSVDFIGADDTAANKFFFQLLQNASCDIYGMARTGDSNRPVSMRNGNPELIPHFSQVSVLGAKQLDG
jgi:hypothetical protein